MSAIAGIYKTQNEPITDQQVESMMQELSKFPADDRSVFKKNHVFLGCLAQWITPESVGEVLPFYDQERKLSITADAIIDNRDELLNILHICKASRSSIPDSQLILLAYCKWGEETPKFLLGDFSFIIWDENEEKLFGARDFSGSRSLYFFNKNNEFAFCSTIAPLLSLPGVKKKMNEDWLAEYLAITSVVNTVSSTITPYENIHEIPPSHSITVHQGSIRLHRYCKLSYGSPIHYKNEDDYIEAFQEVFQKSVDARLRTHRKLGAQLSGGLDSGAVVSFAMNTLRTRNKSLHTFSYIPPKDFKDTISTRQIADERPYILETVKHVGGLKDEYLEFEGKDPYSIMDEFMGVMEMPYKFFENSFWIKGMFEEASTRGIGVLLNGDRGNMAVSWGDSLQYYKKLFKRMQWIKLLSELKNYSHHVGGSHYKRFSFVAKKAMPITKEKIRPNEFAIPSLIHPAFAARSHVYETLESFGIDESGWYQEYQGLDMRVKHFEDLFHWNTTNTVTTKFSLKHNVCKRDPTNDLRVIQFCLSLPEEQFVQGGYDRALIRRATKNYLPDKVRLNQHVRGVQGTDWFHRITPFWKKALKEVQGLLKDDGIMEYIDSAAVLRAFDNAKEQKSSNKSLDPNYRFLMRFLIVGRFMKTLERG
ncbi:asparagine synthase-related protein [Evansella sp. AB-rgal1]|uniref:asparagine synthase-related protein n=1 Tax=Evansella sp. AB-rgal1 TaxID=3242696 RepID=UPI00359E1C2C